MGSPIPFAYGDEVLWMLEDEFLAATDPVEP
jgi:hypothetical protein